MRMQHGVDRFLASRSSVGAALRSKSLKVLQGFSCAFAVRRRVWYIPRDESQELFAGGVFATIEIHILGCVLFQI